MALGDPAEVGHVPPGQQADGEFLPLAGRPEPVERTVIEPIDIGLQVTAVRLTEGTISA